MPEPVDLNRLRRHSPTTVVCLPDDTDPTRRCSEPVAIAGLTGDVLRQLRTWLDADPDALGSLPPPLEDPATLRAIERIEVALGDAYRATPAQPVAPGGRYQLIPLRWARLDRADVATLGRVRQALAGPGNQLVHDVLKDLAEPRRPQALLADIGRLHRLLDLEWDDDVADLANWLAAGPAPRTVVLDRAGADAYRRLTERIIATWHDGNPLARWLYHGH